MQKIKENGLKKFMIYINAGKRIKLLRTQKGLTQKQLGQAVGVKERYISVIESGSRKAPLTFYKDIADYFMVSLHFLFSDTSVAEENMYIDSIIRRMRHMDEEHQQLVLKFVENFSDYLSEKENKK